MKESKTIPVSHSLSTKESKILQMMAEDYTVKEIHQSVGLEPKSIYNMLMILRIKFGFKTNEGMLISFYKNKLIK